MRMTSLVRLLCLLEELAPTLLSPIEKGTNRAMAQAVSIAKEEEATVARQNMTKVEEG